MNSWNLTKGMEKKTTRRRWEANMDPNVTPKLWLKFYKAPLRRWGDLDEAEDQSTARTTANAEKTK